MARTALTVVVLPEAWATSGTPVDPGMVNSDQVNGNSFIHTGKEILIVFNNDVAAQTVTITSAPSSKTKRVGNITAVSVPAAAHRVFQRFPIDGWQQTGGVIFIDTSDPDLQLAVVRDPLAG